MKSAYFNIPRKVEWRESEDLTASGICGPDDYAFRIGEEIGGLRREAWHRRGHEYAGEIVQVGSEVERFSPGDIVSGIGSLPCLECEACASGNPSHCRSSRGCGGEGFTEYLCKKAEWFFPIPGLSACQGALMEPLTVAMEMIVDGGIREGSTVAILGAGPIGLMAIPICRRAGAERIYVSQPSHSHARIRAAELLGADRILHPDLTDVAAELESDNPNGVDTVLVTIRPDIGIPQASRICRIGGRIALIGMANRPTATITLDIDSFHFRKLVLVGSNHNPCARLYPQAAEFLRDGTVDSELIISHRFPISDIADAFDFVTNNRGEAVKVILNKGAEA